MDEEQQRQFAENLRQLNDMIPGLVSAMGAQTKAINDSLGIQNASNKAEKDATAATNANAQATAQATKNTYALTEAQKIEAEAAKKAAEANENFASAGRSAVGSLKEFKNALFDTTVGFGKYGGVLKGAGDAAVSLGKNFGILGTALGYTVKAFTAVGEAALKQADSSLKFKDELAKVGAVGAGTAADLQKMANASGYTVAEFQKLSKPISSIGSGLVSLGTTAGDGAKTFLQMSKVTDETRARFQRLGISQEELSQSQADYIKLQQTSGRSLMLQGKSAEQLRKESLSYTENLTTLAALTGKNVEQIKKEQEAALSKEETLIQTSLMEMEVARLKKSGSELDLQKAAQLEKEMAARDDLLKQIKSQVGDERLSDAMSKFLATGAITEESAFLKRLGVPLEEFSARIKKGENVTGDFLNSLKANADASMKQVGTAAMLDAENRKAFGYSKEMLQFLAGRRGTDENKAREEAERKVAEQAAKGADKAADARASLTNTEIKARTTLDSLVASMNPLLGNFNAGTVAAGALAAAAGVAAIALGKMAVTSAGGVFGKVGGMFGGKGGSVAAGVGGGAVAGGPASAATGGTAATAATALQSIAGGGKAAGAPNGAGVGAVAEGLGKGGGNILEGAAKGLMAFANPKVVLGAAGFGAAITAVGAGIAGATWIIGKALPSLSEGLSSFEKLDGEKLKSSGIGILEIGKGLAVFGAGGVAASFGAIWSSVADGLLGLFGGDTPFKKLEKFSELNIDAKKVKENAEAFKAFGEAMTSYKGGASTGISEALGETISGWFKVSPPVDKMQQFAKLDLGADGAKKIKENSEAFTAFATAMTSYKGEGSASIGEVIGKSMESFFKIDPPVDKMKKFANLDLGTDGAKKVKENAEAFGAFSEAMGKYKGDASISISDIIGKNAQTFFTIEPPTEKMVKFANLDLGSGGAKTVKDNADAFVAFSNAISGYKGGSETGISQALSDNFVAFIGGDTNDAFNKFVGFANLDIRSPESVKKNADAFVAFSNALSQYKGGGQLTNIADNLVGGINKLFGGESVTDKFVKFTKLDVDPSRAEKLAEAFGKYAQGVTTLASAPAAKPSAGAVPTRGTTPTTEAPSRAMAAVAPTSDGKTYTVNGKPATKQEYDKAIAQIDSMKRDMGMGGMGVTPVKASASGGIFSSMGSAISNMLGGGGGGGGAAAPNIGVGSSSSRSPMVGSMPTIGGGGGAISLPSGGTRPEKKEQITFANGGGGKGTEGLTGTAKQLAEELEKHGITNPIAKKAIIQTAAKESGLNPQAKESGATAYLKTLANRGIDYIHKVFPQLKPGGRVARERGFADTGVPAEVLQSEWSKGDENFFDFVYGGLGTNKGPGDAYKYRGRGFIQLTGRTNYEKVGKEVGKDFISDPDAVANDMSGASAALAGYLFMTRGGKEKTLKDLNSMTDPNEALKYTLRTVAGLGHKESDFDVAGSHLHEQLRKASQYGDAADKAVSAAKGAMISGPKSGYPVDLTAHGPEIIAPLTPNSILEKLSKTSVNEFMNETKAMGVSEKPTIDLSELVSINSELKTLMEDKLTTMIDKLDASVNLQDKLYKNTI